MNNRHLHRPAPFRALCIFLLLALCASHAPLRGADVYGADLGEGLHYFRVTNLAGQIDALRAALTNHSALVLDLRGTAASMADARALREALIPADARARVVRFVLINRETGTAVPFVLEAGLPDGGVPGVLVIAPRSAGVPADVRSPGSIEDDRLACEAIAKGADVASLVNQQPAKPRYDEAALEREHQGLPEPEAAETGTADEAEKNDKAAKPPGDSVLQVAVQTHRALVALKRL